LRERKQAATLLSAPFNILAMEQRFNELARATDVIGPYQGNVGATRRSWARGNKEKLTGFIRAYGESIDWLYDGSNREEAIRILLKNVPDMSPELARKSYDRLLDPSDGFSRDARINLQGVRTVLALRSRYAEPAKKLSDPRKYYDSTYYDLAMRQRSTDQ
jgi:ABC-type nitrate/sulfonate/bicarbonate transport system substrate-binding protein